MFPCSPMVHNLSICRWAKNLFKYISLLSWLCDNSRMLILVKKTWLWWKKLNLMRFFAAKMRWKCELKFCFIWGATKLISVEYIYRFWFLICCHTTKEFSALPLTVSFNSSASFIASTFKWGSIFGEILISWSTERCRSYQ